MPTAAEKPTEKRPGLGPRLRYTAAGSPAMSDMQHSPHIRIPTPAHPHRRREPLPWQRPKSPEEDPEALQRVQRILESHSYRLAEADPEFLSRDEARGLRLQLEYLKPETLLDEQCIRHTVVVFGSARICEPGAARRNVEALRAAQAAAAGDEAITRRLAIAGRMLANSHYYEVARELGRLVGEACEKAADRSKVMILTGGGPGMMEAANRGAFEVGAKSLGLNISLPYEQYPNPYITPELCFRFHYFALRKLHFLLRARALVAFPGGYGTMDELFEVLTLSQTRKLNPLPVILVGEAWWRKVFDPDFLVEEGTIDPEDRELFWFAETAEEIWRGIVDWYNAAGRPLLGPPEKDTLR